MNHKLNLNHFADKLLLAGLLLAAGGPALLWLAGCILSLQGPDLALLEGLASLSLAAGGLLLGGLLLLIGIEQAQDALLYRRYRRSLGRRLPLGGDAFECPYCGCRQVRAYQRQCPACWKFLEELP